MLEEPTRDTLIFHSGTNYIYAPPRLELRGAEMALDILNRIDTSKLTPHDDGGMYLTIAGGSLIFRTLEEAASRIGISLAHGQNATMSAGTCVDPESPPEWHTLHSPILRLCSNKADLPATIASLKQGLQILQKEPAIEKIPSMWS